MASLLITLLVLCIFVGAAYYVITQLLPAPIQKWATVILVVICAIIAISFLMGGSGFSLGAHSLVR